MQLQYGYKAPVANRNVSDLPSVAWFRIRVLFHGYAETFLISQTITRSRELTAGTAYEKVTHRMSESVSVPQLSLGPGSIAVGF
jgi:hypothetical protein